MKVAAWNVNSVRARTESLARWLQGAEVDVLLLQEIKARDSNFPYALFAEMGYQTQIAGQKSYNGVAIVSKGDIVVQSRRLPGMESDSQERYLEAETLGLRVASVYAPNGNPVESEKYSYKLAWMRCLVVHLQRLLQTERPLLIGGDLNVAPRDTDIYNPDAFQGDAICRPQVRAYHRTLENMGYTNAFEASGLPAARYTYWDYKGGAWTKNNGLGIDHFLLSPQAVDRLEGAGIDRRPRGWSKPSDHVPIWCRIAASERSERSRRSLD